MFNKEQLRQLFGAHFSDNQIKNMNKMYKHLKNTLNWSDRNIAAVMGNIMQESAFNYGQVSSSGATGAFQFLGDRKKDYEKWIKDNGYLDGGLSQASYLNYIIENKIDPRMDAYNNAHKLLLNKNKIDSINANAYLNKVEPQIKNGTFYPIADLTAKWDDPKYSLKDMTILWSNTIEKPGKHEANLKQRVDYANKFYNMIVPKKQSGGKLSNFQKFINLLNETQSKQRMGKTVDNENIAKLMEAEEDVENAEKLRKNTDKGVIQGVLIAAPIGNVGARQLAGQIAPKLTQVVTKEIPVTVGNVLKGVGESALNASWMVPAGLDILSNPLDPSNAMWFMPGMIGKGYNKIKKFIPKIKLHGR